MSCMGRQTGWKDHALLSCMSLVRSHKMEVQVRLCTDCLLAEKAAIFRTLCCRQSCSATEVRWRQA